MTSLAILLALLLVACAVQRPAARPAPPFTAVVGPVIIAHRGGSLEAPENTVASVRHGVATGADWQEIDVTLTADEQVVVIHDDTLDRTTSGAGPVSAHTLAQLQQLEAGRPRWSDRAIARLAARGVQPPDFGDRYAGERVPSLEQVLAVPDARLMIELKKTDRPALLVDRVVDAVYRAGAAHRVALGSFDRDTLWAARDRDPSLPLIGIVGEPQAVAPMLQLPLAALAVRDELAVAALDQAPPTLAVWVWTIYDPADAQGLIELGVHGIITDVPAAVLAKVRPPIDPHLSPGE